MLTLLRELLGTLRLANEVGDRVDHRTRRDLTGGLATHAVRHHEQGRPHEEVVFVALALTAQVGLLPMF